MVVNLFYIGGFQPEQAEVSTDAVNHAEFAIVNEFLFVGAVTHWEKHILAEWHDEGLGGNAPKRGGQVPVGVSADIPRCHFHAIHSRSLGSITPKYACMNPTWKSSVELKPRVFQCSFFQNSVE